MPIIKSRLDNDFYKLTMGRFVFERYADVPVRYGFTCRTVGANLGRVIPEKALRRELDHIFIVGMTSKEREYLARLVTAQGERLFPDDYLDFLMNLELPPYELRYSDDTIHLEFPGKWSEAIYWEVPALAIINQLYYENFLDTQEAFIEAYGEGDRRLAEKIALLKQHPEVIFSDFGTRRRFSRSRHETVVRTMKYELSPEQFIGTSNVALAMQFDLKPIGTMAHELFMVMAALLGTNDETLRASHNRMLREWWDMYGSELSIALTDTFTTNFFFRDFTPQQASDWLGFRQDSGDAELFADRTIDFYKKLNIDPLGKRIVFSDSLDIQKMIALAAHCVDRIQYGFGIGTNLTNDLGLQVFSNVIKVIRVGDKETVKLSDNLAKATGSDESQQRYMRVFETGAIGHESLRS